MRITGADVEISSQHLWFWNLQISTSNQSLRDQTWQSWSIKGSILLLGMLLWPWRRLEVRKLICDILKASGIVKWLNYCAARVSIRVPRSVFHSIKLRLSASDMLKSYIKQSKTIVYMKWSFYQQQIACWQWGTPSYSVEQLSCRCNPSSLRSPKP